MASRYFENTIKGFEQVGRNLWKYDGHYFRLFGKGITPNNAYLAGAHMRELLDIDIATGLDVYGGWVQELELGAATIYNEYVRLPRGGAASGRGPGESPAQAIGLFAGLSGGRLARKWK